MHRASLDRVMAELDSRPPTLGEGRLLCVDGPTGSGKTTLAAAVLGARPDATVVHMDDLYEGWGGPVTAEERLGSMLRALAAGSAGRYRRWDWHRDTWGEEVTVGPTDLLVVEGVGAAPRGLADLVTLLVWLEAPVELRRRRGLGRDGEAFAPHWDRWAATEATWFRRNRTRQRADLVLSTDEGR